MTNVVQALVVDGLGELADEAAQRALWLASDGPEVSSFTECLSRIWDDSGLSDALDRPQDVYTTEIDDRLRSLRATLARIDDRLAPNAILDDPRLRRARLEAQELYERIASDGDTQRGSRPPPQPL